MHRPDVANISERHEKYTEQNRSGFAASTISLQCPVCRGRAEVRDAREATTAIGANAKTLVFASTTNTDHTPEGTQRQLAQDRDEPCTETQFSASRGRPLVGGETVE